MVKLNLLIDASSFNTQKNLISLDYYVVRLIQGFVHDGRFNVFTLVDEKRGGLLEELVGFKVPSIVIKHANAMTLGPQMDRLLSIIPFKKELLEKQINVVLSPIYISCKYFFRSTYRQILIVHDMIPYLERKKKLKYISHIFFGALSVGS